MAKKRSASSGAANKKLPLNQSIPLGIQHVFAMFAGNITVPIIIAGIFGQTPEQKIFLIQMALFVAGVATIIQTVGIGKVGSKLPIIQGTSFGFIPVMAPFAKFGLGAIFTAAFIGGLFQMFLGYVLKPIRHMFPPLVTGIVVLMIGVSLLGVGFQYAGGGAWLLNNKPEIYYSMMNRKLPKKYIKKNTVVTPVNSYVPPQSKLSPEELNKQLEQEAIVRKQKEKALKEQKLKEQKEKERRERNRAAYNRERKYVFWSNAYEQGNYISIHSEKFNSKDKKYQYY